MQGASLGNGRSPTPPQALCQAKEPGRSPLRPFLYILYFVIKLYIYSTESPMALRLQMPCIIFGASKLRGTIRRKKIKNNNRQRWFCVCGKGRCLSAGRALPLGSAKSNLYDTSRDTNLPSLPHFPLRPFRRPQTPYQDKMPFPVILRRPSPHPPPAALCRPASVIPRHGGAAGPPPAPH